MEYRRNDPELAELFSRYKRTGNVTLRNQLVVAYMDLATSMARRFQSRGEPLEDLEQVARLALVRAVERFDPDHGVPFPGYAIPTLLGELKRYFRDKTWSGSVRRSIKELLPRVRTAAEELELQLGRPAKPAEVAEHLGVSVEDVIEALEAGRSYKAASLSAPRNDSGETLGSSLAGKGNTIDLATTRLMLSGLVGHLDERKQMIIHGRFVDDLSQEEIARRLGISQMHVSRLLRAALAEMAELARAGDDSGVSTQ